MICSGSGNDVGYARGGDDLVLPGSGNDSVRAVRATTNSGEGTAATLSMAKAPPTS